MSGGAETDVFRGREAAAPVLAVAVVMVVDVGDTNAGCIAVAISLFSATHTRSDHHHHCCLL